MPILIDFGGAPQSGLANFSPSSPRPSLPLQDGVDEIFSPRLKNYCNDI